MNRNVKIGVAAVVILIIWMVVSPPRFILNITKSVEISPESGQALVEEYNCRQCHQIDGLGAIKAPNLAGITTRLDEVAIRIWLRNPKAVKGNTAMPNFHLSDSEIEAIVAYLTAVDNQSQ